MAKKTSKASFETGDKVETVHGEKLTVKKVETRPVRRRGEYTGDTQTWILAKSGPTDVWFPASLIK